MYTGSCLNAMVLALFLYSKFHFFSVCHLRGDFPFLYSLLEVIRALHLLIIWAST